MKILIVSDSHGRTENLFKVIHREKDIQCFIHLGDAEKSEEEIRREIEKDNPLCAVNFVRGNCDDDLRTPESKILTFSFVNVFVTHGHRYHPGYGLDDLAATAYHNNCAYALFGHTHRPEFADVMGVTCFNPGSIAYPRNEDRKASYGIMTADPDGHIKLEIKYL